MKNTMFTENFNSAVKEIETSYEKLLDVSDKPTLEKVEESTLTERVHTLFVLKILKELGEDIAILSHLIEIPEEDFVRDVTNGSKKSLKEVEMELMMTMMADMMQKMSGE